MFQKIFPYQYVAAALIGISLMAPCLYSLHFYISRIEHRLEMWREAAAGNLQTLELDEGSLHWVKKGRELLVHHAYFDVVGIEKLTDGRVRITGVFDHEETQMHEAYASGGTENAQHGHTTLKLARWLQMLWFSSSFFSPAPPLVYLTSAGCISGQLSYYFTLPAPPVPPPRKAT